MMVISQQVTALLHSDKRLDPYLQMRIQGRSRLLIEHQIKLESLEVLFGLVSSLKLRYPDSPPGASAA